MYFFFTLCISQGEREGAILRNWLTRLWGLASLKFVGQAGRLEAQAEFVTFLEAEFLLHSSLLRPSID